MSHLGLSGLSKEDLKIKEKIIFDHPMNWLSGYHWKDFKYDGLAVNTQPILVGEDDLLFTDYDHVLACLKSSIPDLRKYSDLLLEFKQLHDHIDRYNEVVLVKCENRSCCNEFRSKVAKEILGAETRLPSPWRNRNLKGHYNTFLQEVLNEEKSFSDEGQPTAMKKIFAGATFVNFFFKISNWKNKTSKHVPSLTKTKCWQRWKFHCPIAGCQLSFASQPCMSQHQTAQCHHARD